MKNCRLVSSSRPELLEVELKRNATVDGTKLGYILSLSQPDSLDLKPKACLPFISKVKHVHSAGTQFVVPFSKTHNRAWKYGNLDRPKPQLKGKIWAVDLVGEEIGMKVKGENVVNGGATPKGLDCEDNGLDSLKVDDQKSTSVECLKAVEKEKDYTTILENLCIQLTIVANDCGDLNIYDKPMTMFLASDGLSESPAFIDEELDLYQADFPALSDHTESSECLCDNSDQSETSECTNYNVDQSESSNDMAEKSETLGCANDNMEKLDEEGADTLAEEGLSVIVGNKTKVQEDLVDELRMLNQEACYRNYNLEDGIENIKIFNEESESLVKGNLQDINGVYNFLSTNEVEKSAISGPPLNEEENQSFNAFTLLNLMKKQGKLYQSQALSSSSDSSDKERETYLVDDRWKWSGLEGISIDQHPKERNPNGAIGQSYTGNWMHAPNESRKDSLDSENEVGNVSLQPNVYYEEITKNNQAQRRPCARQLKFSIDNFQWPSHPCPDIDDEISASPLPSGESANEAAGWDNQMTRCVASGNKSPSWAKCLDLPIHIQIPCQDEGGFHNLWSNNDHLLMTSNTFKGNSNEIEATTAWNQSGVFPTVASDKGNLEGSFFAGFPIATQHSLFGGKWNDFSQGDEFIPLSSQPVLPVFGVIGQGRPLVEEEEEEEEKSFSPNSRSSSAMNIFKTDWLAGKFLEDDEEPECFLEEKNSPVIDSQAVVFTHHEASLFVRVAPNKLPKIHKAKTNIVIQNVDLPEAEIEEDLLNSTKTHFAPIQRDFDDSDDGETIVIDPKTDESEKKEELPSVSKEREPPTLEAMAEMQQLASPISLVHLELGRCTFHLEEKYMNSLKLDWKPLNQKDQSTSTEFEASPTSIVKEPLLHMAVARLLSSATPIPTFLKKPAIFEQEEVAPFIRPPVVTPPPSTSSWSTKDDSEADDLKNILVSLGVMNPVPETSDSDKRVGIGSDVLDDLFDFDILDVMVSRQRAGQLNFSPINLQQPAEDQEDEVDHFRVQEADDNLDLLREFQSDVYEGDDPVGNDADKLLPAIPTNNVLYSSELEDEWHRSSQAFDIQVPRKAKLNKLGEDWPPHRRPCSFYLEGNCRRSDCKFSHDLSNITCRFWEEGSCFKGVTCPFLHGYSSFKRVSPIPFSPILEETTSSRAIPTPPAPKRNFKLESEKDFPSLSASSIQDTDPHCLPSNSSNGDSKKSNQNRRESGYGRIIRPKKSKKSFSNHLPISSSRNETSYSSTKNQEGPNKKNAPATIHNDLNFKV